jgi:hypothetical protein
MHRPNCSFGALARGRFGLFLLVLGTAAGGCHREPFAYVPVSGKVTYEDGSLIPADRFRVVFRSETPPVDTRTNPPAGIAEVDVKTGVFAGAYTHRYPDGIIRGWHHVILQPMRHDKVDASLVPPEYLDVKTTPLRVNSDQSPFDFKIPKPRGQRG